MRWGDPGGRGGQRVGRRREAADQEWVQTGRWALGLQRGLQGGSAQAGEGSQRPHPVPSRKGQPGNSVLLKEPKPSCSLCMGLAPGAGSPGRGPALREQALCPRPGEDAAACRSLPVSGQTFEPPSQARPEGCSAHPVALAGPFLEGPGPLPWAQAPGLGRHTGVSPDIRDPAAHTDTRGPLWALLCIALPQTWESPSPRHGWGPALTLGDRQTGEKTVCMQLK